MVEFFANYGGIFFTVIGALIATLVAGLGSTKGCATVGRAAAGVIAEEPEKFGQALLLQLLPGTQGLYGFIIGFLILTKLMGGIPTMGQGIYLLFASLPVGIIGYLSAIAQASVSAAGLQILVKNGEHSMKGAIFAAIVETYAILGFVCSIIMVFATYPA